MNCRVIGGWERVLVLAPHTDDGEFGGREAAAWRAREGTGRFPQTESGARPVNRAAGERWRTVQEEGGPRGKHGFPRANSATAACG
jgi:hypothetical protein